MAENVTVTQRNFKNLRMQYGIKVQDVADVCNLSKSTVCNFEKCKGEYTKVNARSYNGDMMLAALQSLINGKKNERILTPEEAEKRKVAPTKKTFALSSIDSMKFYENLKEYCKTNKTTIQEFSDMCGISSGTFTPWYCKKYQIMTMNLAKRISEATGWKIEQMSKGEFIEKKAETKVEEPLFKNYPRAHIATDIHSPRKFGLGEDYHQKRLEEASNEFKLPHNAQNIKYIYDPNKDGRAVYYITYSVPTFYRQELSKDKFMELVEGKNDG